MTTRTWTATTPGYTELRHDGRVRGYVEHRTMLVFWNHLGPADHLDDAAHAAHSAFSTITSRPYTTIAEAQAALQEHVDRLDAVCDGRRGIQGRHDGCSPERCAGGGLDSYPFVLDSYCTIIGNDATVGSAR